jgi:HK97 family phage major capsid protein
MNEREKALREQSARLRRARDAAKTKGNDDLAAGLDAELADVHAEIKVEQRRSNVDLRARARLADDANHSDGPSRSGFLEDPEARERIDQMMTSKMPVGRVALGEVVSREELLSDFGGWSGRPSAAAPDTTVGDSARRGTSRGIVPALRRPLRLLDIFPTAPMDGASFDYVQEPSGFAGASEQVEGAVKAAVGIDYVDATAYAETVAVFTKIKKQADEDQAGLRTAVSNNLTHRVQRRVESQILAGTGHENGQIQGILEMTGVGSVVYSATELEADQTLEGIVTVLLSDAVPNFVALHPRDWANMLKEKASGDGHYFSAGAFAQTAEALWGVPAIPTPAIAQGQALVGDATVGATVLIRSGVQAFVSDADQDDFSRNRLTVLAETRAGVAVWQPAAFALVDFTA